ncbi:MAG: hypothetical protein V1921_06345 [Candidatus Altiarchaeota archaeon]
MAGTKIIKLKLEEGLGGKLPALKPGSVDAAIQLYEELTRKLAYDFLQSNYGHVLDATKGLNIRSDQMQDVVSGLEKLREGIGHPHRVGLFLTALMQNSPDETFLIAPKRQISHLGYRLEGGKEITVEGSLDDYTGSDMKDGRIYVKGYAGSSTGEGMKGGEIIVEKSAKLSTGRLMAGGKVHIKGGSGTGTGAVMSGGEIIVDGTLSGETGAGMEGGTIRGGRIPMLGISSLYKSGTIISGGAQLKP